LLAHDESVSLFSVTSSSVDKVCCILVGIDKKERIFHLCDSAVGRGPCARPGLRERRLDYAWMLIVGVTTRATMSFYI
jgi:hypothetical protein